MFSVDRQEEGAQPRAGAPGGWGPYMPPSLYINEKTPPRLGFKREGFYWTFIEKGKGKYTGKDTVEDSTRSTL
ncbi:hypothetical protein ACLOJK_041962, partial [Asimina triloba]